MKRQLCPKCKRDSLILEAGGLTGTYKCKKCGYVGSLVIEEDI
jgi:ribosomal protein L37AE/L43A